jgi:hypothetical protein
MLLSLRTNQALFLVNAETVNEAIEKYKSSIFYIGEVENVTRIKTTSDLYDKNNYRLEIKLL